MATARASERPASRRPPADNQELQDFCGRPACRQPFLKTVGPGRPQSYCSEICRRTAEREFRQAKARLAHYEAVVEGLRMDIAAFNLASEPAATDTASDVRRAAEDAVTRVEGLLAFIEHSQEPLARELRSLHQAVAPVVRPKD